MSSGILFANNSTNLTVSTNLVSGTTAGVYTATITLQNESNPNNPVVVNVTLSLAPSYSYYLPFVANNLNGFTSNLILQNTGSSEAILQAQYYDQAGHSIGI